MYDLQKINDKDRMPLDGNQKDNEQRIFVIAYISMIVRHRYQI